MSLPSYRVEIDPDHPECALETEWLLTNGLGGYAMGTALGVNTRRYHGLLTAALQPPVGRHVMLHSLIEQLQITLAGGGERTVDLSTQQFLNDQGQPILHPKGLVTQRHLLVKQPGLVEWTLGVDGVGALIRGAGMWQGVNGIEFGYDWMNLEAAAVLRVRPLLALRSAHHLNVTAPAPAFLAYTHASSWRIACEDAALTIELRSPGKIMNDPQRWHTFYYERDAARGQEAIESLWSPGLIEFDLSAPRGPATFHVTMTDPSGQFRTPRNAAKSTAYPALSAAAQQFVVMRLAKSVPPAATIIAGYPWFSDWGRDAMIAMPGLMLCNQQFGEAEQLLCSFALHMRNGLIPNRFDDHTGEAEYNTVDASLWFVYAVHQLWTAAPSDLDGRKELLDACRAIIITYRNGADFNIFMDTDGLIAAGDATTQLTWMDATRGGIVFTPRHGKPVEVNALWFNALNCLAAMTDDESERDELLALAQRVGESFRAQFWWAERGCLHDVLTPVDGDSGGRCPPCEGGDARYAADGKLRPNQVLAVSLPHSPLDRAQQRAVVDVVREKFLTPYGLRSLDRDDPDYRGRYEGDMMQRDAAYHNGTVWPWLIGPYCESVLRVNENSDDAKRECREAIQPLIDSMQSGCLGQIAEIYDGDPPHRPDGCPAQAWSVAEVLRIRTLTDDAE